MNGQEQKERNTAVAKLERRVTEMGNDTHDLLNAEIDQRRNADIETTRSCLVAIGEERTARFSLANEQRSYVDNQDSRIERRVARFEALTCSFWARLRWLITGGLD